MFLLSYSVLVFSVAKGVIVLSFIELLLLKVGRYNLKAFVASSFKQIKGDSTNLGT